MINKNKKIGVWGMGRVGTAVCNFLYLHGYHIGCMDRKQLKKTFPVFSEQNKTDFFNAYDVIIPSPGIDIRADYKLLKKKLMPELELFVQFFHKPIISITGSVGKTTVTTLLSQLLSKHKKVVTGGNIGTALFDLIEKQTESEWAILELSSFQLEYCTTFAPKVAVITNINENHLDRHGTMHNYIRAKCTMIKHQKKNDITLVPFYLIGEIQKITTKNIYYFSKQKLTKYEKEKLKKGDGLFFLNENILYYQKNNITKVLYDTSALPSFTFNENWLIIIALFQLLNIDYSNLNQDAQNILLPNHRLELVKTIRGVDFYNDSKATTPAATRAAIEKLKHKPIILLLGGLSKGIDRALLIKEIKDNVKMVICFGKEAKNLYKLCEKYTIKSDEYPNLADALVAATNVAQKNDCILLSPAGSSFDLFQNYEHRGNYFKQLVETYASQQYG